VFTFFVCRTKAKSFTFYKDKEVEKSKGTKNLQKSFPELFCPFLEIFHFAFVEVRRPSGHCMGLA